MNNDDAGTFTRATRLLRKTELTADGANQLIDILGEMTSTEAAKIIERVEAKIDAMRWFIGAGIAVVVPVIGLIAAVIAIVLSGNAG